jgi:hypothetical protein
MLHAQRHGEPKKQMPHALVRGRPADGTQNTYNYPAAGLLLEESETSYQCSRDSTDRTVRDCKRAVHSRHSITNVPLENLVRACPESQRVF